MPKLNDTQLILLSTATQRDGRSLWPLPEALAEGADRAAKAIAALMKRGLAEERETKTQPEVHRTDGDLRFGAYISVRPGARSPLQRPNMCRTGQS